MTHVRTTVEMPFDSAISYFISDNYLAVAGAQDVVYNLATDVQRTIPTAGRSLNDFVRRGDNELWLESSGQVFDLDLPATTLTQIAMPALVGNINVAHDLALTTALAAATVYRTEMASREQLVETTLPSPFITPPPDTLGYPSATHRGRLRSRRAHDGDATALDR